MKCGGTIAWGLLLVTIMAATARGQVFEVKQTEDGAEVSIDGALFTRYVVKSGAKPILWPIFGPTGKEMTRAWPMRRDTDEKNDHVHQRSFWFTHGDVNGISFWHEENNHGTIEHRDFVKLEASEGRAVIATANDWLAPDGKVLCSDVRHLTFGADATSRWIDFDIMVTAGKEAVTFGDTKEGTFGIRTADSLRAELEMGGTIINSEGLTDDQAWGKRAAWVDYYGPVDGEQLGIAILNHPASLRYPTYWHVRTYGLFAANPFGVRDFQNDPNLNGSHTLQPGESFSLYYRVIFHAGSAEHAGIAQAFQKYAAETRPK